MVTPMVVVGSMGTRSELGGGLTPMGTAIIGPPRPISYRLWLGMFSAICTSSVSAFEPLAHVAQPPPPDLVDMSAQSCATALARHGDERERRHLPRSLRRIRKREQVPGRRGRRDLLVEAGAVEDLPEVGALRVRVLDEAGEVEERHPPTRGVS